MGEWSGGVLRIKNGGFGVRALGLATDLFLLQICPNITKMPLIIQIFTILLRVVNMSKVSLLLA